MQTQRQSQANQAFAVLSRVATVAAQAERSGDKDGIKLTMAMRDAHLHFHSQSRTLPAQVIQASLSHVATVAASAERSNSSDGTRLAAAMRDAEGALTADWPL